MTTLSRLLIGAAVVLAGVGGIALAQKNTLIEPEATAALTKMGGYLPRLHSHRRHRAGAAKSRQRSQFLALEREPGP